MTMHALFRGDGLRAAYAAAAASLAGVVAAIGDDRWDGPGLGVWTVRDLTGHAARALVTVESAIGRPADRVDAQEAIEYFRLALGAATDADQVAQRGRDAGAALGEAPAAAVRELAERVVALVERTPDDALVTTLVGGMRLVDYLPTRVFELVVHTEDLAAATNVGHRADTLAVAVAAGLVGALAAEQGLAADLLLAATGRRPLPAGYHVV